MIHRSVSAVDTHVPSASTPSDSALLRDAAEAGRVSAVAGQGQRDLQQCAAGYGDLYAGRQFDPALYSTIALAGAFTAPWLSADDLRTANRTGLWVFGLDWRMDHEARSLAEVRSVAARCLAVAEGAEPEPDDQLTRFLADLRDALAAEARFADWREVWSAELRALLEASEREWIWKAAAVDDGPRPTVAEYLRNANNFGSTFVNVSHWLATGELATAQDAAELSAASSAVQRVLRLLNDLATHDRDVRWGDLNVLQLGLTRADVHGHITTLVAECEAVLAALGGRRPEIARYLERQLGFCVGFYGVTDFWGEL